MQARAQLTPSRSRINSRFAVNWTNSRKGTHSRSEINGSNYNRLRNPIAKAGRPWRHGHCRRVPFAVAQSRIRVKEKSDCQPNANRPNSFQILKSARAPIVARARLLIATPSNAEESAQVIIVIIVVATVSLSTANCLIARYTGITELPHNCCNLT